MSIRPSVFESIVIYSSNDPSRKVDITSGTIMIDYYEDVFSPTITAKMRVFNVGNTIATLNSKDNQLQSLYSGLPLRGGEKVSVKISGNSSSNPGLDFLTDPESHFYVSSITDVIAETNKESFTLNLVSKEAIINETVRVTKKYEYPINESVQKILTEILKTNKIGRIDKTSNTYSFIGNLRKPFTILTWLSSKSVPEISGRETAGFFFYQTVDGFQFRSIDSLNTQTPKATYIFSEVTESYDTNDNKNNNDFKILNYNIEYNQQILEKLRTGTYSSTLFSFNPLTGNVERSNFKYSERISSLGREPLILPDLLVNSPTRNITSVFDIGTLGSYDSKQKNANPVEYQSQILLRYNVLLTQTLNLMIPSNTNLRAGDVIECFFPKISRASTKEYDDNQNGLYMIKELCHHFDARNSYTSLRLVRDTFGAFGGK